MREILNLITLALTPRVFHSVIMPGGPSRHSKGYPLEHPHRKGIFLWKLCFLSASSTSSSSPCYRSACTTKNGLPLKSSLELLFHYGAAATLIIPVAKFLLARLLHVPIPVESSYYTLAALIAAWLLPYLASLFRSVFVKVEFKKHEEME